MRESRDYDILAQLEWRRSPTRPGRYLNVFTASAITKKTTGSCD
jgi:hypothetical protein